MASRDSLDNIHTVPLFTPANAPTTDNTAYVSAIIDTAGFETTTLVFQTGTLTSGVATFAVLLEDGDQSNLSDNAAVSAANTVGSATLASFTGAAGSNKTRKIGYVGPKRYVRLTVTPTGNVTSNVTLAGVAVLTMPRNAPTANPPQ
jgi:hypothetical protein